MLKFFDCNCRLGKSEVPFPGEFSDAATLKENMKKCNIAKAIVWHKSAASYHPTYGNRLISSICQSDIDLTPMWVVMPNYTGEFYDTEELAALMKVENVRAVKLSPSPETLNYSLKDWSCGRLFEYFELIRTPVFVSLWDTDLDSIYKICNMHRNLKLILTDIHFSNMRDLFAIISAADNLYIETSHIKTPYGIEDLCKKIKASRLLFGSGMPVMEPGCAVTTLVYATISKSEREQIAYYNMESMLDKVVF